jgi:adenine-specific DNA-methyltransferase
MENRISISKILMKQNAALINAIDDEELYENKLLLDSIFNSDNYISTLVLQTNPRGRGMNGHFATSHDYLLFYGKNKELVEIEDQPLTEDQKLDFKHSDSESEYRLLPFRRSGGLSTPADRPNSEFTIYYDKTNKKIIGIGGKRINEYPAEYICNTIFIMRDSEILEVKKTEFYESFQAIEIVEINPIDGEGKRRVWRWSDRIKIVEHSQLGDFIVNESNNYTIQLKDRIKEGRKPKTIWYDSKYDGSSHGTILLENILGESKQFGYPKSINNVYDSIFTIIGRNQSGIVIDYFAGSGTTGHATIKLNREDGGNRKYILVEMGTYFNSVTKPRIQKVIYSDNWKNGKPQDKGGISQIVKYQVLESYEDSLNNLYLKPILEQGQLELGESAKEEYLLQYMLEMESRDHLFNLEMFRKPFDYELKVTENNELKATKVDLVETFNYLIGLYVSKVQRVKDIKVVEGTTRSGIKTLVIWRDLETTTHEEVEKLLRRFYDSQRTKAFQQIYINGDHHLENLRTEGDSFKIKLIEETFFKKMFNESEL